MSAVWLYQMSADLWPEAQYRLQVWEGSTVFWPVGKIKGPDKPDPGDRMICWYAKTGSASPGICGWGVVLSYDSSREEIAWRPVYPSDRLKMHPVFDGEVAGRVDGIRGGFNQGTLWPIERDDADWFARKLLLDES